MSNQKEETLPIQKQTVIKKCQERHSSLNVDGDEKPGRVYLAKTMYRSGLYLEF